MEYHTQQQIDINEKFSIDTIKFPCNIVIIGPTNTGKTTILKHILLKIISEYFGVPKCFGTFELKIILSQV